ncbi:MAG: TonB-dependent receptor [Chitinophagaceae bacterium]
MLQEVIELPSVAEIASNGIHEGTNRYEFGNKNLKTESSFQIDAGLEFDNEHFSFNTSVFYNNIHNYIFYRKLESVNGGDSMVATPNGDAMAFKFSQSNATLYGFEAKFDVHPHPLDWLHFENTFSLVMGRFATDIQGNNKIPFIPAPRWQSELRADFKQLGKHLSNTYFKIEMDKVSTQNNIFSTYNTETITNGYTLLNIGAGTNFKVKSKKIFSIYLALNNATNVAYQNHLSRLKYTAENVVTNRMGVFNMGRNFSAKIIVPFNFSVK